MPELLHTSWSTAGRASATDPVQQGGIMPNTIDSSQSALPAENEEAIPVMQQILDNPFLLLFLGVAIPTVFYVVWGVMEIVTIPIAK
jgi:hypothetical protein